MTRKITPHPRIGYTTSALDALKKTRASANKKMWKAPHEAAKEILIKLWEERAIFHPVKGALILATYPFEVWGKIHSARLGKRMAVYNVASALSEEMKRDSGFKSTIKAQMDGGYKWLKVNRDGEILLKKSSGVRPSVNDHILKNKGAYPAINFEEYFKKSTPEFVNAAVSPTHTMLGVIGNELTVSRIGTGKDTKINRKDIKRHRVVRDARYPGKKILTIETNAGKVYKFITTKDDAVNMLKKLRLI